MCCFSSTIKSGALDFVPLQFAVFGVSVELERKFTLSRKCLRF
jgi:hypothetical protein